MVEGAGVGLGLVEGVEEAGVVDIVKTLGLVLCPVGALDLHADGRRATSVAGTEGAERGRLHTLYALVVHERDPTLVPVPVPVPVLRVLVRGPAPCLTLPTRDIVGAKVEAGAGVARRVPDL